MPDIISIETADMQRREAADERPQDRYAGRLKFTGCQECGSRDGMQAISRETLRDMTPTEIEALLPWYSLWYSESGNDEELFYACSLWKRAKIVPLSYDPMTLADILTWTNDRDPMAPDYTALAAEEPVLASEDSPACAGRRDAAGV